MRMFRVVLLMLFTCMSFLYSTGSSKVRANFQGPAVTYSFSGGRFGDNLLAYLHAKWISYKYNVPILYRPFEYSDMLELHFSEQRYPEWSFSNNKNHRLVRNCADLIKGLKTPSLLVVPYYPEAKSERDQQVWRQNFWPYISVDWNDSSFKQILRKMVKPRVQVQKIEIPPETLSVACHLRRGGGFDSEHTFRHAALKFPQDNFFIAEIRELLKRFPDKQLYVYLFTDDPEPLLIKEKFKKAFECEPITFDCRVGKNAHNLHVLDDFFALTQFDCCIHGESNFAICASTIADYIYESQPLSFHWDGNILVIDRVERKIKKY